MSCLAITSNLGLIAVSDTITLSTRIYAEELIRIVLMIGYASPDTTTWRKTTPTLLESPLA